MKKLLSILDGIYCLAFFKEYTDMPRFMEIAFGILFWFDVILLIYTILK
jgi:hypothetical protein